MILIIRVQMGNMMLCARFCEHPDDDSKKAGYLWHGLYHLSRNQQGRTCSPGRPSIGAETIVSSDLSSRMLLSEKAHPPPEAQAERGAIGGRVQRLVRRPLLTLDARIRLALKSLNGIQNGHESLTKGSQSILDARWHFRIGHSIQNAKAHHLAQAIVLNFGC